MVCIDIVKRCSLCEVRDVSKVERSDKREVQYGLLGELCRDKVLQFALRLDKDTLSFPHSSESIYLTFEASSK